MGLLHKAMSELMRSLFGCQSTTFDVSDSAKRKWHCFPVVVAYCCIIPEGKGISGVKH